MPSEILLSGEMIEGWFPIMTGKGKQNGELNFSVQYVPLSAIPKSYEVSLFNLHSVVDFLICGPKFLNTFYKSLVLSIK